MLESLSSRLNFTYEMVRVTEFKIEPSEKGLGLFNYLWDQQCDLLVHDVIPTPERNKVVDLTTYWIYDRLAFLIPVPDETANIDSVIKPFQWPVWLGLGISIVCVIAILNLIRRYLECRSTFCTGFRPNNEPQTRNLKTGGQHRAKKRQTGNEYLYVLGNLLSQGVVCPSKQLPYRLVASVWILAAFIFVQSYTSTLFTYVVTPISHPLVNSIYDVIGSSDINLIVRETGLINTLLSNTNHSTGIFATLQKKVDSFPNSRCVSVSDCIRTIKPELRNVLIDANVYLKDAIRNDFKKTGKCNFQMAKEGFIGTTISLALPKNSPYTQRISQGILEVQQTGVVDFWDTWIRPMPPQCNGKPQSGNKKKKTTPLSLKNLTGAFLVLSVGLSLSFLAFLVEKVISIRERHHATEEEEPVVILD
ncbi:uncharacterized protein LOC124196853 isoform X2 [Daphnia pulex]|uniref:uncharacterized protein LOC124196853 isoform X2 n=1 Tax=Daphnia pulex TaxID=6669 RepID=UPI001EDFE4D5|nr:uncharacterized protein LOC124196853 isoform X2 [Daphnia pulex]